MNLSGEEGEIPSLQDEIKSLKQDLRATQTSLAQIKTNLAENSSLTIEISPHQLTRLRQELVASTNANMARLIKEQQKRRSNGFTQIINNLESVMQTLSASELLGTVFSFLIFVALFSGLGVSIFFWAFPPPLSRDASFTMNKAKEPIEFANVKLQRIEKKIGSDSNSLPIKK
jgi:F0F1-type ATP synthase membrane subunit b/b'